MWFFQGLLMNQYPPEYFYALISLLELCAQLIYQVPQIIL